MQRLEWRAELVCPLCKGPLDFQRYREEWVCFFDRVAFPQREDIPILLVSEARPLPPETEK